MREPLTPIRNCGGYVIKEQRAQKNSRFLRGRQIAFMIYEHFRSSGFYEEIQGLTGLFSVRLEKDDIHDFDSRWKQALLSTSDPPSDKIFGRSVKIKIAGFFSTSDDCGIVQSRNSWRRKRT